MFYFHSQYGSTVGRPVAMDTAGRDGRTEIKRAWVRIPVSQEVMGSGGICKYLSCLSLTLGLCYCMRAYFVSVCIN